MAFSPPDREPALPGRARVHGKRPCQPQNFGSCVVSEAEQPRENRRHSCHKVFNLHISASTLQLTICDIAMLHADRLLETPAACWGVESRVSPSQPKPRHRRAHRDWRV